MPKHHTDKATIPASKFELFCLKFKKPLLLLLIAICLIVALNAFKLMMADIRGYQAKRMIERWETHDKIGSQEELDHAYNHIEKARWWAAEYPDFIQYEALILKWHATSPEYTESDEQAEALLQGALNLYEEELIQRPTWPYAWSAYANTKLMLGEIDDKFAFALDRAFYYGPWESQIQLEIIKTGFSAWPNASTETKKLIFKTIGHAFQGNAFIGEIIALTKEKRIFALVCMMPEQEKYSSHIQKQCDKALGKLTPQSKPAQ